MGVVHDIVPSAQLQRIHHPGALGSQGSITPGRSTHRFTKEFFFAHHHETGTGQPQALGERALNNQHHARSHRRIRRIIAAVRNIALPQQISSALDQAMPRHHAHHAITCPGPLGHKIPDFFRPRSAYGKSRRLHAHGSHIPGVQGVQRNPGPWRNTG